MQTDINELKPDDQHLLKYAAFNNKLESESGGYTTSNVVSESSTKTAGTTLSPDDKADSAEQEGDKPLKIQTKKSYVWMLPLPKLLIAAAVVGLALLIVFVVTQGMMSGPKVVTQTPPPSPEPASTTDPQTQNGTLQSEVMVGKQGSELEKWNHPGATKVHPFSSKVSPSTTPAPVPVASVAPVTHPASAPVASVAPVTHPAPTPVTSADAYAPLPVTSSYARPKIASSPTNFTPTPKGAENPLTQDPQKEWNEAANEGSFGGTSSDTRKTAAQASPGITTTSVPLQNPVNGQFPATGSQAQSDGDNPVKGGSPSGFAVPYGGRPASRADSPSHYDYSTAPTDQPKVGSPPFTRFRSTAQLAQNTDQVQNGQYQRELNSSDPSKQLILGTQGEGRVDTTIRWSNLPRLQSQTLVIKVTQPLQSADNKSAVIPKGSYLTAQILNIDSNGFLSLSVVSVNLNINGQIQLSPTPLPSSAIQVFNKKGDSLQAKLHGVKNGSSFLSILSNAARATGIVSNNAGFSAFNALANRQPSSDQNVYFSLDQGTLVRLYVLESFSL